MTLRWWILGGTLFASTYVVRRWLAARRGEGGSAPFPWLEILAIAATLGAVILAIRVIRSLKRTTRPRPSPSYPCPSCGFIVFSEPAGSYDICEICGWEDDDVQLADPTSSGGANSYSLATSQKEILKSLPLEIVERDGFRRDPRWRPLRDEDLKKGPDEGPDYYWLRNGNS